MMIIIIIELYKIGGNELLVYCVCVKGEGSNIFDTLKKFIGV